MNYIIKIAKCDNCGGDAVFVEWPAGWIQIGTSKYGKKYDKDGLAWLCPRCREKLGYK